MNGKGREKGSIDPDPRRGETSFFGFDSTQSFVCN